MAGRDPTPLAREARFDDLGDLWVRDPGDSTRWDGYGTGGELVGALRLGAGRLLEIGANYLVTVERDTLDLEQVVVRMVAGRPVVCQAPGTGDSFPPETALPPSMTRALGGGGFLMAQEMYYSGHGRYAASAGSLAVHLDGGLIGFVLYGTERHWAGLVWDPESGLTCGVSVGSPAPAGWGDGTPICGR